MFLLVWQILFPADFLVLPIFGVLWILLFRFYRDQKYKGTALAKYFIPALAFRFLGAVLTAFMYQYYYGYGDTFYYFFGCKDIYNAYLSNPSAAFDMLFVDHQYWDLSTSNSVTYHKFFLNKEGLVVKIAGFLSPLGLGTYMGTSLVMTIFSFLGSWAMYRVFYDMYPHLHFRLALAVLFLPSMCFWSTGIMKDSLVIGALGFFVNGVYYTIISKEKKLLRSFFFIILGVFLMKNIKIYVLIAILPAVVIWVFFMYKERIQNPTLRKLASPLFFGIGILGGFIVIQQLGSVFSQYTFDGFMHEAEKMQWWLKVSTERDGGSGYDLGVLDPSLGGLLRVFPKAVNVALFRPYIWEARKVIIIPSAAEALFTLLFTVYVFFKVGIFKTIASIIGDPVILFCLIFAIIFAFAVGFTSYNFGALARYKIPCLPFYFIAMILLLDKIPKKKDKENHQPQEIGSKEKPKLV